ncbi:hypothetical protein [Rothia sp. HMSC069C01]|uniref:hypothetical protein n=1 Tax=Rothia sp. HMSC069C01 TaxID=1739485 RepID=UPI0008A4D51B|nr:hypothetical protein [Rothia sp. HMSC069C01]
MNKNNAMITINKFILRAKRVESHSLLKDINILRRYAETESKIIFSKESNKAKLIIELPPDEEVFESLVSRIRPFILRSEPIFYEKIFSALEFILETEELKTSVSELKNHWDLINTDSKEIHGYSISDDASHEASDLQLAGAWLYADLVHADPKGNKKGGMDFSMKDRYVAAVRIFSSLALLTVETLAFIYNLEKLGIFDIPENIKTEEVVIGKDQIVREGFIYQAPVGTEAPNIQNMADHSDWRLLTRDSIQTNYAELIELNESGNLIKIRPVYINDKVVKDNKEFIQLIIDTGVIMILSYEESLDSKTNFQVYDILIHDSTENADEIVNNLKNVSGFIIKTTNWVSPIFKLQES